MAKSTVRSGQPGNNRAISQVIRETETWIMEQSWPGRSGKNDQLAALALLRDMDMFRRFDVHKACRTLAAEIGVLHTTAAKILTRLRVKYGLIARDERRKASDAHTYTLIVPESVYCLVRSRRSQARRAQRSEARGAGQVPAGAGRATVSEGDGQAAGKGDGPALTWEKDSKDTQTAGRRWLALMGTEVGVMLGAVRAAVVVRAGAAVKSAAMLAREAGVSAGAARKALRMAAKPLFGFVVAEAGGWVAGRAPELLDLGPGRLAKRKAMWESQRSWHYTGMMMAMAAAEAAIGRAIRHMSGKRCCVAGSWLYKIRHKRKADRHGPASGYLCAHCGGWAEQWATVHGMCPDHDLKRGYLPLCRQCHAVYDGQAGAGAGQERAG